METSGTVWLRGIPMLTTPRPYVSSSTVFARPRLRRVFLLNGHRCIFLLVIEASVSAKRETRQSSVVGCMAGTICARGRTALIHSENVRASDASTGIIARLARFGGRSGTSLAHASAALESTACDGQSWPWARGRVRARRTAAECGGAESLGLVPCGKSRSKLLEWREVLNLCREGGGGASDAIRRKSFDRRALAAMSQAGGGKCWSWGVSKKGPRNI
jgi:hypothetical protein